MERIGELLSKGISLMLANEPKPSLEKTKSNRAVVLTDLDEYSRNIVQFIQKVGFASPREMESRLEVARRTVLRKLKQLQELGILSKHGNTTSTRYEIDQGIVLQDVTSGTSCAGEKIKGERGNDECSVTTSDK